MKLADSIDKYKVYELQGKGGFADVYRAVELETGTEVAIKKISKQSVTERKMWDRVKQELAIHSVLEHPSIVRVYTCFQDATYIYLVLEFCPNGELRKLLEERNAPFNENQARGVLRQVLAALKYLHSHRIIHRDITLSNLLLTRDWTVKVADFGLAVKFCQPDEKHKTMCGTPNYLSPEVVTRKDQGPETDIWNAGIVLYTLLVGKPPFDTDYGGVKSTLKKVVTEEIVWPSHLSPDVVNLMDYMLKKNPRDRLTLNGILNHRFMVQTTCEDLRMFTPASTRLCDDSGFMTTPSTWLTAGECSGNNTTAPFKLKSSGLHSRGYFSPFNEMHQGKCCSTHSSTSKPLRANHSTSGGQPSIACSHVSSHCIQCSHVENCACCLMARLSFNSGYSNHHCSNSHQNNSHGHHEDIPKAELPKREHSTPPATTSTSFTGIVRTLPPDLPVPPLNTTRLIPKLRTKGKSVYFSILDSGEVCLEFFKEKSSFTKIIEVVLISSDGMLVSLQHPYDERITEPGRGVTSTRYKYEDLPERFLKKYLYASKCVNNEKAVTSKIIYYSPLGKCHLMENGPDPNFTIHFYSGGKIIKKGSCVEILDKDYKIVSQHPIHFNGDGLEPNVKYLWEHFKVCWEECLIREKDLEELSCRRKCVSWFPNTSGQKPHNNVIKMIEMGQKDKENFSPSHVPVVVPRRGSESAPSSLVGRPRSSQSNSKYKVFKKVTVSGIGVAIQMTSGLVRVHYVDESTLEVQPSISKRTTIFLFTDVHGRKTEYRVDIHDKNFSIPSNVREKISLYGIMVEKLKEA